MMRSTKDKTVQLNYNKILKESSSLAVTFSGNELLVVSDDVS